MKTLQACYELEFNKITFQERKHKIIHNKTIIIGPSKCGKSYLIYDYLSNFLNKEYLYIDLNDAKNHKNDISTNLEEFIKINFIKVLVIENFDFDFTLPACESIILTSNKTASLNTFNTFKKLYLMPLDFEEFLLHDNRHQSTINTFNYFFKHGNLPGIINIEEHKKEKRLQEIIKIYTKNETQEEVLKILFLNIDEKKSLNQLYLSLKKRMKISKDLFYSLCKVYEENRFVFFVKKYQQEKAIKKIYAYNHSFLSSLSHSKKFKNAFTNMIFLELLNKYKNISYLDNIDFFLEKDKTIILCLPFFNNLLLNSLTKKVFNIIDTLEIKKIFIITIANNDSFYYEDIKIEVVPFYEWALI